MCIYEDEYELSEEFDEKYRLKKCNSRKSMAALFVYRIIKAETTPTGKHLFQNEILNLLEEREEITLERKALSRILHTLQNSDLGICSSPRKGVWYDESEEWVA